MRFKATDATISGGSNVFPFWAVEQIPYVENGSYPKRNYIGAFQRPHKHQDPTKHDFWYPPYLEPWNQHLRSSCLCGSFQKSGALIWTSIARLLKERTRRKQERTPLLGAQYRNAIYRVLHTTYQKPYALCQMLSTLSGSKCLCGLVGPITPGETSKVQQVQHECFQKMKLSDASASWMLKMTVLPGIRLMVRGFDNFDNYQYVTAPYPEGPKDPDTRHAGFLH